MQKYSNKEKKKYAYRFDKQLENLKVFGLSYISWKEF